MPDRAFVTTPGPVLTIYSILSRRTTSRRRRYIPNSILVDETHRLWWTAEAVPHQIPTVLVFVTENLYPQWKGNWLSERG